MAKKQKYFRKLKSFDDLVTRCGGFDNLISITGVGAMAIYAWGKRGIPQKYYQLILMLAKDVSFDDLARFDYSTRFPNAPKNNR